MGRKAVRQAVQSFIQTAKITYVGTVYPSRPFILPEAAYTQMMNGQAIQQSSNGSACVVVVHLVQDKRLRRADTGRGAVNDTDIHQVVLELFFANAAGTALNAQSDYDVVVDGLMQAIRNNPLLAAPTVIWSAGEFAAGVVHDQGEPYTSTDGLTLLINSAMRFEAWEWDAYTIT